MRNSRFFICLSSNSPFTCYLPIVSGPMPSSASDRMLHAFICLWFHSLCFDLPITLFLMLSSAHYLIPQAIICLHLTPHFITWLLSIFSNAIICLSSNSRPLSDYSIIPQPSISLTMHSSAYKLILQAITYLCIISFLHFATLASSSYHSVVILENKRSKTMKGNVKEEKKGGRQVWKAENHWNPGVAGFQGKSRTA